MQRATRKAVRHITRALAGTDTPASIRKARQALRAEDLAAVSGLIGSYREGGTFSDGYQIARITLALRDLPVRDDAWSRMVPGHNTAHLRMWTDIVRHAQPGHVAPAAALLAFTAWQAGNGTLANCALDRAMAEDPSYSMALLLRQVISAGAPPSLARLPMTPEEVAASYAGTGGGDAPGQDTGEHDGGGHDHHQDLDDPGTDTASGS